MSALVRLVDDRSAGRAWRDMWEGMRVELGAEPDLEYVSGSGSLELRAPAGEPLVEFVEAGSAEVVEEGSLEEAQNRHQWARDVIRAAFLQQMGRGGTRAELQVAQAIGLHESTYGRGWRAPGQGSHNWGAVQAGRPPCKAGQFDYTDSHANGKRYPICFRAYPSDVDGAADMIRYMYQKRPKVLRAVRAGSLLGFSTAMLGYYEGFGDTKEERIAGHAKAVKKWLQKIADGLGEPVMLGAGSAGGIGLLGAGLVIGGIVIGVKALGRKPAA